MKKRLLFLTLLLVLIALLVIPSCNQVELPWNKKQSGEGDGDVKWAGIRVSSYGMRESYGKNFPSVSKMSGFASQMESKYEGSTGAYILIVGTMSGDDTCHLYFPVDGDYQYIESSEKDMYESYLDEFDKKGYSVWLQVEPGYADLVTLAKLVLDRYGKHSCVKGFGIDVEWHRPQSGSDRGTKLTADKAKKVLNTIRTYNSEYTLFVKHWIKNYLPKGIDGLIYINDSQNYLDIDFDIEDITDEIIKSFTTRQIKEATESMREDFTEWAEYFSPCPVMFQIGYERDKPLWKQYTDPAKEFGEYVVGGCSSGNDIGVIWVDFTLSEVLN